ncbi:MAG: hypothetical protein ABIF88_02600 [archaeon]
MVTTIQISNEAKSELDRIREGKQTYEQIILGLLKKSLEDKKRQEELLIEGCKVMAEDSLKINKEWEFVDAEIGWEW